jgi:FixJ family two-component response regulator
VPADEHVACLPMSTSGELVKPFNAAELIDAIRNSHQIMETKRAQLTLHHDLTAKAGT